MSEALDPEPQVVNRRLAPLDLTVEDLLGAVRAGVVARRTATRHHPRAFGGWLDYGERIAALRELTERGWTAEELDGVCLTVHPARRHALMTAMGTSGTGTDAPVTTKRKRGEITEMVVAVNAQLEFDLQIQPVLPALQKTRMPTWVLLVATDGDEVRSELSLARHIENGFVDSWIDRLPLPVIRLNDVLEQEPEGPGDSGHEFDVPER